MPNEDADHHRGFATGPRHARIKKARPAEVNWSFANGCRNLLLPPTEEKEWGSNFHH
jgi:hypothetical protein